MKSSDVQKILDKYEAIEANGNLPVYREVWPCFKAIIELAAIDGEPWAEEAIKKLDKAIDIVLKWDNRRNLIKQELKKNQN